MLHVLAFIIMKNKHFVVKVLAMLIVIAITPKNIYSEQVKIQKLWTGADFRFGLHEHFDLDYSQEVRLDLNEKRHRYMYNDFALRFKPSDALKFSAAYRHRQKNSTFRNEMHFNAMYGIDLRPIEIDIRLRLHRKYEDDDTQRDFLRGKLSSVYRFKRDLRFGVQAELFNRIDAQKDESLEKARYGASIEYRFSRQVRMELKYLYEDDLTKRKPKDAHIYGIYFDFRI